MIASRCRAALAACLAALLATASAPRAATLTELSRIVLRHPDEAFGGLSGLALMPDGLGYLAVTDRGNMVTGRFTRDTDGQLAETEPGLLQPLLALDGGRLTGRWVDSEGVAPHPDAGFYVSFEQRPRIWHYPAAGAIPTAIPSPPAFASLQRNSGLEALAIDASGTLYAMPERSGQWERPFPVFRYRNGRWDDTLRIPRSKKFLITGATFGPDGYFYVVERDFVFLLGFATRIRRFRLTERGFEGEELLLETPIGTLDNMEAIDVWRDAAGDLRIIIMADDNFRTFQRTLVVEYRLSGTGASATTSRPRPRP